MKQLLGKRGQVVLEDTPAPLIDPGEILVQVCYSCISSGTEMAGIQSGGESLFKKAIEHPENIRTFYEMVRKAGVASVITRVRNFLATPTPLGYSAAGIVLEVGDRITDIKKGDKVACAGAGIANHAEFIAVPRNLIVKVPENSSLQFAATVTLGSIALQGVRRASPALGEIVTVIGLGVIGQLTVQLLKANGCQIIGIDHDPRRIDVALSLGMHKGINANQEDVLNEVLKFTNGFGADSVIITAATLDNAVINRAIEISRKKGKVIIVGDVGLALKREEFYKKELDVMISTSYGPGRYDESYEARGNDYPYAYVRWTENRNMEAFLNLLDQGRISVGPLIEKICPLENAPFLYEELKSAAIKPLICLLEYNKAPDKEYKVLTAPPRVVKGALKIAVIGAGEFVKNVHLPNLRGMKDLFSIYAVSSKKGTHAQILAKQYGARYAASDYRQILQDKNVDAVLIATRHNLHAQIAMEAAQAGKAVFLEKPMALTQSELDELCRVLEETKVPFTVGFNRRFSPGLQKIKKVLTPRSNPLIINYRMNAGFIPADHWVHSVEGGGRNIGEACHVYDAFNYLTESTVESISASSIAPTKMFNCTDNFAVTVKYKDGSLANLIYTSLGSPDAPKEIMEIYCGGGIIHLHDYKKVEFAGFNIPPFEFGSEKKGHSEEWVAFVESIKNGNGYPIASWQLVQATEISFAVENQITQQ